MSDGYLCLKGRSISCDDIASVLIVMVEKHARQLGLTKNDLGPVGASRLVDLLTRSDLSSVGYKSAQVITAIYLSSNDIKDEGFKVDFINQVFRFFSKYSYILFNCNIMNIIDDMLS